MRMTDANLTRRIIANAEGCRDYTRSLRVWGTLRSVLGYYAIDNDQLYFRAFEEHKPLFLGLVAQYPDLITYSDTHGLNSGQIRNVHQLVKALERDYPVTDERPNY